METFDTTFSMSVIEAEKNICAYVAHNICKYVFCIIYEHYESYTDGMLYNKNKKEQKIKATTHPKAHTGKHYGKQYTVTFKHDTYSYI